MKVAITGPQLDDPGGVANYYRTVLPTLRGDSATRVDYLAIGSGGSGNALFSAVRDQWYVVRALRRLRPDVLHVNPSLNPRSFVRDALFIRSAKAQGIPVLVFFHGWSDGFAATVDRYWRAPFRRSYGLADAFVVLASTFERRLRDWGVEQPVYRRLTVVDESLAAGIDGRTRADAIAGADPVKILFLARLEESKGIFETLEAVRRLRAGGRAVHLTVAGSGGALDGVRRWLAEHDGMAGVVRLAGYVSGAAKRELFHGHHLFCMPTWHGEGMPISVLEAIACGLPVVTSPAGGLADLFRDERLGCLVRARDADALTGILEELLRNRGRMRAISAFNTRFAREHVFARSAAADLLALYDGVRNGAGRVGWGAHEDTLSTHEQRV